MIDSAVTATRMVLTWLILAAVAVVLCMHDATSGWAMTFGWAMMLLIYMGIGFFLYGFVVWEDFDGCLGKGIGVVLHLVLAAATIALVVVAASLGPAYHTRYGERADAVITDLVEDDRGVHCRIALSATEADLGWLDGRAFTSSGCAGRALGQRIEVSVDPRNWVTPVSVDRLGSERALVILFGTFLAVFMVGVVAVIVLVVADD